MDGRAPGTWIGLFAFVATVGGAQREAVRWTFDDLPAGQPPAGFVFTRTGEGSVGRWEVVDVPAPGTGKALAQLDADSTSARFPIAVADAPALKDVKTSVRCRPVSGRVDQACGIVVRYRDAENYYLARANALEKNVRLYVVKSGRRQQIASWSGAVPGGAWSSLALEVRGDGLVVSWNEQRIIEARDGTFAEAGRAGLWTKADSVTWFDDFVVAPLA